MKRYKPLKGQTLLLHDTTYRRNQGGLPPREVIVETVGSKYFTLKDVKNVRFSVEDWSEKTDYSSTLHLYESEREYKDYLERIELNKFFREFIEGPYFEKVELEHLREAKSHFLTAMAI